MKIVLRSLFPISLLAEYILLRIKVAEESVGCIEAFC